MRNLDLVNYPGSVINSSISLGSEPALSVKSYNLLLKGLEKGARTIGPLSKYESYDRWKTKFYEWLRAKVPNLFEPDNSLIEAADHNDNFIDYAARIIVKCIKDGNPGKSFNEELQIKELSHVKSLTDVMNDMDKMYKGYIWSYHHSVESINAIHVNYNVIGSVGKLMRRIEEVAKIADEYGREREFVTRDILETLLSSNYKWVAEVAENTYVQNPTLESLILNIDRKSQLMRILSNRKQQSKSNRYKKDKPKKKDKPENSDKSRKSKDRSGKSKAMKGKQSKPDVNKVDENDDESDEEIYESEESEINSGYQEATSVTFGPIADIDIPGANGASYIDLKDTSFQLTGRTTDEPQSNTKILAPN